jgi:hypothetical protein
MKFSILSLAICLLAGACTSTADAKKEPTPERSTEFPAPKETAAAAGERVQPEIRYYEVSDT